MTKLDKTGQKMDFIASQTIEAILTSKTLTEAANKLGIARQALYGRIKSHHLQEVLEDIANETLLQLKMAASAAAEELVNELSHHNVKVRHAAAVEILNRVLPGKIANTPNQQSNKFNMTKEEIERILEPDEEEIA